MAYIDRDHVQRVVYTFNSRDDGEEGEKEEEWDSGVDDDDGDQDDDNDIDDGSATVCGNEVISHIVQLFSLNASFSYW